MTEKALSPFEVRKQIVMAMRAGKAYNANELSEVLGVPAPRVSNNLRRLVEMGIVVHDTGGVWARMKAYCLNLEEPK